MKSNTLLLGLLMVALFGVGVLVGRFTVSGDSVFVNDMKATNGVATEQTKNDSVASSTGNETPAPVPVSNNLSEGQRKMLIAMGIDPNTVTLTPEMIACAETKVGAARVEEIKNGATPSISEGITLMACYKK